MHKHTRWTVSIALLLLVSLIAVPGLAQDRQPETTKGAMVPGTPGPLAPPRPLANGGLLYKTSLDIGDLGFSVYDPATNVWTTLTPFETGCQMASGSDGTLFAHDYYNGDIRAYDPATDTWSYVIGGPPGASGYYCNLEVTVAGEFLYTEANSSTLWYTTGGVWNTMALPFTTNAMGDYEPATDQYVIGQYATTNAHLIDVHTWTITDFSSSVGNGEYARFGVVMSNRYYFEAGGSNIHWFDLGNPAAPPVDSGLYLAWYSSAAADRANHIIYVASLDGTQLWAYDEATNTGTPLAGGSYGWHSSLTFIGAGGPPPDTLTCGMILAHASMDPYGRIYIRWRVEAIDQNMVSVPLVAVTAELSWPTGGPVSRTRLSRATGFASFPWGSSVSGPWTIDVTNMALAGYTFADGPNCTATGVW